MAAKKWQFSKAQESFKVQMGDVWHMRSAHHDHVLVCGDLEKGAGSELLARFGPAQMLYTDPPWGKNLASSFRSQAGAGGAADYHGVLRAVARVGASCGIGFFEMSVRDTGLLRGIIESTGARIFGEWGITYSQKRPCRLLGASWGDALPLPSDPTGMTDFVDGSPTWAIQQSPEGATIVDPCTGLGTTFLAAAAAGRRFIGLELNPSRVAEVLKRAQADGLTVHRESR